MRKIISLICLLLPALAFIAEPSAFAEEPGSSKGTGLCDKGQGGQ